MNRPIAVFPRIAALLLLTLLALASGGPARAQGLSAAPRIFELDHIVAVVNDDVIVFSELVGRLRTVEAQLRQSGTALPPPAVLRRQVLERLVLDRIQLQLAAEAGIRVGEEALNRAVSSVAQRNQLSLGEFRDILERDGYDFGQFREEIRNEILISQVRQRFVNSRVTVSPRDIDNHLATLAKQGNAGVEYRLAHILVAVPEGASPEQIAQARQRAEAVLEELETGGDFSAVAAARSDGQQALQGGDLGFRKLSELPAVFVAAVQALSAGGLAGPIQSPSGFHVIKLLDTRGSERHVIVQTHARHMLIRTDEINSDAEVSTRLAQLRDRVVIEGVDFGELARVHSADTGSAVKGGDLGWLSPGAVLPEFQREMDALSPGEISAPFRTQFGWHIVQVLERREQDSTEEVRRAKAAEEIRARKVEEELQSWLRQIRDEAFVEFRLEEV